MSARSILADYSHAEVVAKFGTRREPVRIVRTTDWRPRGGRFDVYVGDERVYAGVNDSWGARWLASNFAPDARPTPARSASLPVCRAGGVPR